MINRKTAFLVSPLLTLLFVAQSIDSSASSIRPVKIRDLFAEADFVAIVKIVSGDSEHYSKTVYKATVIAAFKGTTSGEKIFLGPYDSLGVGSEYLAFMIKTEGIAPKASSDFDYGSISTFYQIMYGGYSIMPVGYECVFDGKEIKEHCDYSVQLNTSQIILPSMIKTFPNKSADAITNYKKWVRRDDMVSLVRGFSSFE